MEAFLLILLTILVLFMAIHFRKASIQSRSLANSLASIAQRLQEVSAMCQVLQEQINAHEARSISPEAFNLLKDRVDAVNGFVSTAKAMKGLLNSLQHRVASLEAFLNERSS